MGTIFVEKQEVSPKIKGILDPSYLSILVKLFNRFCQVLAEKNGSLKIYLGFLSTNGKLVAVELVSLPQPPPDEEFFLVEVATFRCNYLEKTENEQKLVLTQINKLGFDGNEEESETFRKLTTAGSVFVKSVIT